MFMFKWLHSISSRLKVSRKLTLAFSVSSILLLCISILAVKVIFTLNDNVGAFNKKYLPIIESMGTINSNILQLKGILQNHIMEHDLSRKADNETKLKSLLTKINNESSDLKGKITEDDPGSLEYFTLYTNSFSSYTKALDKVLADSNANNTSEAVNDLNNIETDYFQTSYNISKLIDLYNLKTNNISKESSDYSKSTQTIVIVVSLVSVLFMLISGLLIVRSISRPLKKLESQVQTVANGDLTGEALVIHSHDEIGNLSRNFTLMITNLKEIIGAIIVGANGVAVTSAQLSSCSEQMNKASELIAGSVDGVFIDAETQYNSSKSVFTTIEEIAAGMERVGHALESVSELSVAANHSAESGLVGAGIAVDRINEAQKKVDNASVVANTLGHMSNEISTIMSVISDIADQTNLLSLNASIEAARAGEHGRGFSVVANEIRKLAEKSKISTNEVRKVVNDIKDEVVKVVESVNEGKQSLHTGADHVNKMGESFSQIAKMIRDISEQTQEVSDVAQEVTASSEAMVHSAHEMSETSRHTASSIHNVAASVEQQISSMEEISASSEALSQTALGLQETVRRFKMA